MNVLQDIFTSQAEEFANLLEDIDISILFEDDEPLSNSEGLFDEFFGSAEVSPTPQNIESFPPAETQNSTPDTTDIQSSLLINLTDSEFTSFATKQGVNPAKIQDLLLIKRKLCHKLALQVQKLQKSQLDHISMCLFSNRADIIQEIEQQTEKGITELYTLADQYLSTKLSSLVLSKRSRNKHLPRHKKDILFQWFMSHLDNPYPTKCEKLQLARQTELDERQIDTWFTNMRLRRWKPKLKTSKQKEENRSN